MKNYPLLHVVKTKSGVELFAWEWPDGVNFEYNETVKKHWMNGGRTVFSNLKDLEVYLVGAWDL